MKITIGRVTAIWLIAHALDRLGGVATEDELLAYARRSGLRAGSLPIKDGYELAKRYHVVTGSEQQLSLSNRGLNLTNLSPEEDPTQQIIQAITAIVYLQSPPNWVAIWQGDATLLKAVLPPSDKMLLEQAGFLGKNQEEFAAQAWWDALSRVPLETTSGEARKLIGNAGEELTLAYERRRLAEQGFPDLARRVRWVAQESDAYGFDVLSSVGNHDDLDAQAPLAIEVKSMAYPSGGRFRLHLTRHEYVTARRLGPQHVFHLWDSVRTESRVPNSVTPRLTNIGTLESHVPRIGECQEACAWSEAIIELMIHDR